MSHNASIIAQVWRCCKSHALPEYLWLRFVVWCAGNSGHMHPRDQRLPTWRRSPMRERDRVPDAPIPTQTRREDTPASEHCYAIMPKRCTDCGLVAL
jgi:hypothetical protein